MTNNYREKVDKDYCKICNLSKDEVDVKLLEVDHINRNRKDNSKSNLRVLCKFCHMKASNKKSFQDKVKVISVEWINSITLPSINLDFYSFVEDSEIKRIVEDRSSLNVDTHQDIQLEIDRGKEALERADKSAKLLDKAKIEERIRVLEAISNYINDVAKIKSTIRESFDELQEKSDYD
jgi:hypothetical protein